MFQGNEVVVRRLIEEVLNGGETSLLDEFVAIDHVGHDPLGDRYGPEGARIAVMEYRAAFPDLHVSIEDLIEQTDRVVHRFTLRGTHSGSFLGIPPTGRSITVPGIAIDRFAGGKVVETWTAIDALNLLRQLGASPTLQRFRESRSANGVSKSGSLHNGRSSKSSTELVSTVPESNQSN